MGVQRLKVSPYLDRPGHVRPRQFLGAARSPVHERTNSAMGINYCDAMMYWKAKERGVRFDKVLTLGHQTLCLHPSEVTIFRDAYRKAFASPSGTPLADYQGGDYADRF